LCSAHTWLCAKVVGNFSDNPVAAGWQRCRGNGADWKRENGGVSDPDV